MRNPNSVYYVAAALCAGTQNVKSTCTENSYCSMVCCDWDKLSTCRTCSISWQHLAFKLRHKHQMQTTFYDIVVFCAVLAFCCSIWFSTVNASNRWHDAVLFEYLVPSLETVSVGDRTDCTAHVRHMYSVNFIQSLILQTHHVLDIADIQDCGCCYNSVPFLAVIVSSMLLHALCCCARLRMGEISRAKG